MCAASFSQVNPPNFLVILSILSFTDTLYMREMRERTCDQQGKETGQNLVTNALKHLMDQLEERILQIDQLKNTLKRL